MGTLLLHSAKLFLTLLIFNASHTQTQSSYSNCFQESPNKNIQCANLLSSQSGISENQCLGLCCQNSQCQAVVYRTQERQCNLYSTAASTAYQRDAQVPQQGKQPGKKRNEANHRRRRPRSAFRSGKYPAKQLRSKRGGQPNCGYQGPYLEDCPEVNYYKWTGACQHGSCGATTAKPTTTIPVTDPLPSDAVCPPGQVARYLKQEGTQIDKSSSYQFIAESLQQCLQACTANQLPSGGQAPCLSVNFNPTSLQCMLISDKVSPDGNGNAVSSDSLDYYQKICLDSSLVAGCPLFFNKFPQKVLVGHVRAVTDASTLNECLKICLNSQSRFGFYCISGMFYINEPTNNCLLNTEYRITRPDLFIDENIDQVTYFEALCRNGSNSVARDVTDNKAAVLKINSSDWGGWTNCDRLAHQARHFKQCKKWNPNSCKIQSKECVDDGPRNAASVRDAGKDKPRPQLVVSPCLPVVKSDGTNDCLSLGFRVVDGHREYCQLENCKN